MHIQMVLLAAMIACGIRYGYAPERHWQGALLYFVAPPLLLTTTAAAILLMMPVAGIGWDDWLARMLSLAWLLWLPLCGLSLTVGAWRSISSLRRLPLLQVAGAQARLLTQPIVFAAQVGFWKSELVVSQGLIDRLDRLHLEAVLAHEHAHRHYRDTFWFFWLGWIRRCTFCLPNNAVLWEELLTLRERRADRRATAQVNPLVLAEALMQVATAGVRATAPLSVPAIDNADRLAERIEALLAPEVNSEGAPYLWLWLLIALMPWVSVPFHFLSHHGCPGL